MTPVQRGAVALTSGPQVYESFEAMAAAAIAASPRRLPAAVRHVAEFRRRLPGARVEMVSGSGHAVQSDRPLALARLIEDFVFH